MVNQAGQDWVENRHGTESDNIISLHCKSDIYWENMLSGTENKVFTVFWIQTTFLCGFRNLGMYIQTNTNTSDHIQCF